MFTKNCTVQQNKWAPIYILHSTLCTLHCIPFLIVLLPPRDVQFIMSVNFRVYVTPLQTLQIPAASVRLPLNVLPRQQLCQFPLQGIPTSLLFVLFSHDCIFMHPDPTTQYITQQPPQSLLGLPVILLRHTTTSSHPIVPSPPMPATSLIGNANALQQQTTSQFMAINSRSCFPNHCPRCCCSSTLSSAAQPWLNYKYPHTTTTRHNDVSECMSRSVCLSTRHGNP